MKIEISIGRHLRDALREAAAVADREHEVVTFDFNGTEHEVRPWESEDSRKARAEERSGGPILTAEEEAERARKWMEDTKAKSEAAIAEARVPTEMEMRDAEVPWPKSEEDLTAYIRSLVDRPHDYGTCVYAMSMAAVAALYYVSGKLGVTGFQASCADMDILRRTRHLKHGFRVVDYGEALYPQYWEDHAKRAVFQEAMRDDKTRERFAEEARSLLAGSEHAAPRVREHWQNLARISPAQPNSDSAPGYPCWPLAPERAGR